MFDRLLNILDLKTYLKSKNVKKKKEEKKQKKTMIGLFRVHNVAREKTNRKMEERSGTLRFGIPARKKQAWCPYD